MFQFFKRIEGGKWHMQWNIVSSNTIKISLLNFDDNILISASKGNIIEKIVGEKITMDLARITDKLP